MKNPSFFSLFRASQVPCLWKHQPTCHRNLEISPIVVNLRNAREKRGALWTDRARLSRFPMSRHPVSVTNWPIFIATPQMHRQVAAGEIGDLLLPTEKPDVSGFSYDVAIHRL
jgi:hypothetical protein